MRALIAFATVALLALSAFTDANAQGMGMGQGRGRRQADTQKSNDKTTKADEQAYKDALKRIPEKKTDPWGSMR
jgi:hypothetical protein